MALRIQNAFGVKMDTLMRMQSAYDIAHARKREKEIHVRRDRGFYRRNFVRLEVLDPSA
jgi:plasmid maintenance system antidote protein VapI